MAVGKRYPACRSGWVRSAGIASSFTDHRQPDRTNLIGLTTLPRVAIHSCWNIGEMLLLVLAARESLPQLVKLARKS